jgi:hypothetical protein
VDELDRRSTFGCSAQPPRILTFGVLFAFLCVGSSVALEPIATPTTEEEKSATEQFKGAGFGAGLTLTVVGDRHRRIKEAEVVAGVVRVTKQETGTPRVMLETHYFFAPEVGFLGLVKGNLWGWGPFLGIQNGSEEIIEAVGAGLMLGFRRSLEKPDSFNFGVGGVFDPRVKELGDGVLENRPLPAGEDAIRFKETGKWGWLFVFSFGF